MKKVIVALLGVGLLFGMSQEVSGYVTPPAIYTWDATQPGYNPAATLHAGTIDPTTLVMGDFVGRSSTQPNAASFGDSGVSVGWDDTWTGGGNGNTNGDALDGLWVQIFSSGGWWDLGSPASTIAVFTSQDHGPYLGEGLEYRVYGTNTLWDNTSLSSQVLVSDVYLDGWRPHNPNEDRNGNGWCSDDIAGVYNFGQSYQYVKLVAWNPSGGYSEPEVDAVASVAPVPEASTLMLFGSGLSGLLFYARKRRLIKF